MKQVGIEPVLEPDQFTATERIDGFDLAASPERDKTVVFIKPTRLFRSLIGGEQCIWNSIEGISIGGCLFQAPCKNRLVITSNQHAMITITPCGLVKQEMRSDELIEPDGIGVADEKLLEGRQ